MKQMIVLTAVCAMLTLGLASCHHHHGHHDHQVSPRYDIQAGRPRPGLPPPGGPRPGAPRPGQMPPPAPRAR